VNTWLSRHPVSSFFVLAYAISWSVAVPLALQARGMLSAHLPWALHYLMPYGPALAALSMMRLLGEPLGGTGVPAAHPRSGRARWWTIGFAAPLLMFAAAQLAAHAAGQTAPPWHALGHVNFLPDLGLGAWWLWFATSGLGEEVGWRGFLLPRLQQRHSPFVSSLLLAIGWAGWHLPAFFYVPSYAAIGLRIVPAFFFGILAGAIVLTWLYNRSGGSVMATGLWHASFNFVTASPDAAGVAAAVTSTLVVVWAIVVMVAGTLGSPRGVYGRSVRASAEDAA
jgi:membrane protease YdiL (CAAX protease family)